ncbi:MAG TPA: hypothetical protein VJA21_16945 [Verrucomicrobiae bacterium]
MAERVVEERAVFGQRERLDRQEGLAQERAEGIGGPELSSPGGTELLMSKGDGGE